MSADSGKKNNESLSRRVATAVVLAPPVLAAVLLLPQFWFAIFLTVIALLVALEWAGVSGYPDTASRWLYGVFIAALSFGLMASFGIITLAVSEFWVRAAQVSVGFIALSGLWWLLSPWPLMRFPHGYRTENPGRWWRILLGLLVIPAAVLGLLDTRASTLGWAGLLVLLALIWATDIGAYFAGRAWGRRKLAPTLSPGKTWEGFAGGMAAALLVALVAHGLMPVSPNWVGWICLCLLTAVVSVLGDLVESLLKRLAKVKDSGGLLPGHGGILDRVDSLLAAAPVFAIGLHLMGL